ncbi:MAG: alpha/beta fold hydrolase [Burkholderiaceae bacterium]
MRVSFPGSQGTQLDARLDLPDLPPRQFALFAHCFTCTKESKAAAYVARSLTEHGFGVLRFDFTGLGGSEGDFGNTGFSSNLADLRAAGDWLRENHGPVSLLVGHSLGGAAVLAVAGEFEDCRAVATIGAPFDPAHVQAQFGDALAQIEREGKAEVSLGGRPFTIRRDFIEDLDAQPQARRIHELRKPLLIMHAPGDRIVGVDQARQIFEQAVHPKSFVSLDDADHLLSRASDARYASAVLAAWASRYMPEPAGSDEPPVPAGLVRVAERGTGRFTCTVSTAAHHILADEPTELGGDDLGLSPYQLLQAALGSCTVMTLRMVAERRGWPLSRASVDLHHEKIHAADCAECETREGKVDRIERVIHLEGDLSREQREALLTLADRCPVHRTLHGEIQIISRLDD